MMTTRTIPPTYEEVAEALAVPHPQMHVIDYGGYLPGGAGTLASVIVLTHNPGALHPYIVWMLVFPEDRPAFCHEGGYFETLPPAVDEFQRRVAHDSWPL